MFQSNWCLGELPRKCSTGASITAIFASEPRPQIPEVSLLAELKWSDVWAWRCLVQIDRSWSKAKAVS